MWSFSFLSINYLFKGLFVLSSFHVVANLYDFHFSDKHKTIFWRMLWLNFIIRAHFQNILFYRKKVIQVWNDKRVSKWWQTFHFCVNIHLKCSVTYWKSGVLERLWVSWRDTAPLRQSIPQIGLKSPRYMTNTAGYLLCKHQMKLQWEKFKPD